MTASTTTTANIMPWPDSPLNPPQAHCPASFRDRDGFVFRDPERGILRQVNRSYEANYRLLKDSGLYQQLVDRELLVEHEEESLSRRLSDDACCILRPRLVPFISYPYEWSFSALKDAALLTLEIQRLALERGLSLKDASAYNVQFVGGQPLFIDSLSFEARQPGAAWAAYGQFCRHFLAPLALMAKRDARLQKLLVTHLDGIPLDLAHSLLPKSSWLSPGLAMHIHLHAMTVERKSTNDGSSPPSPTAKKAAAISDKGLMAIIESLRAVVQRLEWKRAKSTWSNYYQEHTYTTESEDLKHKFVRDALQRVRPSVVWDMGANTGLYSRLAAEHAPTVVAMDHDLLCVDHLHRHVRKSGESIVALNMDLTNPSPALGWAHRERDSLIGRGPADLSLALALIHHIVIGNNVPLEDLSEYFRQTSRNLVIEFVPPTDVQVRRLLRTRQVLPHPYSQTEFEQAFARHFNLVNKTEVTGGEATGRVLYLLRRKSG